jgi:hypothetical protein
MVFISEKGVEGLPQLGVLDSAERYKNPVLAKNRTYLKKTGGGFSGAIQGAPRKITEFCFSAETLINRPLTRLRSVPGQLGDSAKRMRLKDQRRSA